MHALIIEDDGRTGLAVWNVLQDHFGFESVTIAQTEQAAIEDALRTRPALVTCDVHLKTGLGTRAVNQIRKMHGPIPMIYITGSPTNIRPSDPQAPIIVKPFTARMLIDGLRLGNVEAQLSVASVRDQGWRKQVFVAH